MLSPQLTVIWDSQRTLSVGPGIELQKLFGLLKPAGSMGRSVVPGFFKTVKCALTTLIACALMVTPGVAPTVEAAGQTRTLKILFIHTKEKASITYKRNGRYDAKGLQQINRLLRDWRRNEPTKMDPRLLDLVWEVYQKTGARDYIHVVSGYRSPATNGMLRSRSKGVAKKSQHMLGKAMDFYIPGVKLKTLREVGMKFQVGGVGYYPRSGSPFVHMDVGGVRAWPRMSRQELARLFPDGKTIHLPSDGKPLPGYQVAMTDYKRRVGANAIQVAGGGAKGSGDTKRKGNLFAMLFGGGDEDEEPDAIASSQTIEVAEKPASRSRQSDLPGVVAGEGETVVASRDDEDITAPVPLIRPAFKETPAQQQPGIEVALVEPRTSAAEAALEAATPVEAVAETEFADLSSYKIPVPEMLAERNKAQIATVPDELMTASADVEGNNEALGFVPVPAFRPAGEQALAALSNADVAVPALLDRGDKVAGAASELPDEQRVAALDDPSGNESAGDEQDIVALINEGADEDMDEANPIEMAALLPVTAKTSNGLPGDAFEDATPRKAADDVTKGSRPKKADADAVARSSIRTEPKLTEKIISKWALSNTRVATISKPVKAPRFVSKTMRAAPTTVYSAGFTTDTASVDAGRFSGNAVNFLAVKKFSTN